MRLAFLRLLPLLALTFAVQTGAEDIRCPDGTESRGKAPPRGLKLWCALPDKTQEGPSLAWYEDGTLFVEASFKAGELEGSYRENYRNGSPREEGRYHADAKDGVFTTWWENGQKARVETWKAGKRDGPSKLWHKNGKLFAEQFYRDGVREGPASTYYDNGQQQSQGTFVAGQYDGEWKGWWEDGRVKKTAEFDKGREITRDFFKQE